MFEVLIKDVLTTFTEQFLKIQVTAEPPRRPPPPPPPTPKGPDDLFAPSGPRKPAPATATAASGALSSSLGPIGRSTGVVPEVGRNDPCPCGSGKKYKKCHGAGR
jgi:uncharacterized protein YecA (UPF0149 family)